MKFLPIPYVNYNRSLGYQIGAVPVVLFNLVKSDTVSPSSIAGMAGVYTENKTWFLMGFSMLYLQEDNWRILAAGGLASVNFQFFLENQIGGWIPYNTELDVIFAQVQRRVFRKIYAGVSLVRMNLKTSSDVIPIEPETRLNGLGLQVSMDRRSNVRYPRSGFETTVRYFTYPSFLGNEAVSNKIELTHNHFLPMRKNTDVLAGRVFIGLGLGDLSFNQQLIVGRTDIRGYTQGGYRGNYLVAAQGEYRWNFLPRWGAVGFAGAATLFQAINEQDNGKILPGVGAGFRYTVDTETSMNVGMEVAAGIDDWGVYFRIGEAF